jgi:Ca2+-binding EF-hand superfamily protein
VLWHMFKKHDKERRSIIAISDFYDKIVFVPRTIFCDGLFDLIEAADSESIDFGEFVAAVTTYCFFEIPEVLKFCFFVFDRDKKGFITQEEMRLFVDAMHGNEMSTNVEFALDNLKYRKDGKFDFEEFKGMHHLYPSVLFPAFRSAAQCPNFTLPSS